MSLTKAERETKHAAQKTLRDLRRKEGKAAKENRPKKVQPIAPGQRDPRHRDKTYLAWIRRQPCAVANSQCFGAIEAAHVRFSDARVGRVNPGMQSKPDDKWTAPLCRGHHRGGPNAQHDHKEQAWWLAHGVDATSLCLDLQARFKAEGGR